MGDGDADLNTIKRPGRAKPTAECREQVVSWEFLCVPVDRSALFRAGVRSSPDFRLEVVDSDDSQSTPVTRTWTSGPWRQFDNLQGILRPRNQYKTHVLFILILTFRYPPVNSFCRKMMITYQISSIEGLIWIWGSIRGGTSQAISVKQVLYCFWHCLLASHLNNDLTQAVSGVCNFGLISRLVYSCPRL